MALTRTLQALLVGLKRQTTALSRWHAHVASAGRANQAVAEIQLTGRELAGLSLLAHGLTSAAIGHRLNVATRTVSKHLEHVYAKLRVSDRLSAVVRAQGLGVLAAPRKHKPETKASLCPS